MRVTYAFENSDGKTTLTPPVTAPGLKVGDFVMLEGKRWRIDAIGKLAFVERRQFPDPISTISVSKADDGAAGESIKLRWPAVAE